MRTSTKIVRSEQHARGCGPTPDVPCKIDGGDNDRMERGYLRAASRHNTSWCSSAARPSTSPSTCCGSMDLRRLPLATRKARLRLLLGRAPSGPLRLVEWVVGSGCALFAEACARDLEGVMRTSAIAISSPIT